MENKTCFAIRNSVGSHEEMDKFGKTNGLTVTFAEWHPNPEYRVFKTGTLLSRNKEYPAGLVLIEKDGDTKIWKN